jgi:hypothetical protein
VRDVAAQGDTRDSREVVYERVPAENETDYGREARALLGRGVAAIVP